MYAKLLFELHPTLAEQRFLSTDVGKIYQAIPWSHLVALVPPPAHARNGLGCKPWFTVQGGIALQFLKHYLQLSDAKLIERINTDWVLQYFCGIQLKVGEVIHDKDLPSWWRCYLGQHLDIGKWQKVLATKWKKHMQQTQTSAQDATCYESRIRWHQELLGKCKQFSGDAIYATNKNRSYLKRKGIAHNFAPKGRQKAAHIEPNKLMAALLNKERGTKLEGSFGNEKNHYLLGKVKAPNQSTETCWIFFGIHTANAVTIGKRIAEKQLKSNPPPQRELRLAA